jgi:hypothetical protein
MIKYALKCANDHEFDSWFPNAASFDGQVAQGQVACPICGATAVGKAIMAPAVSHSDKIESPLTQDEAKRRAEMRALRRYVMGVTEDVGTRFPDEARKIAEGSSEERPIRGEATREEAKALLDEGIHILPLPFASEDMN